MASRRQTLTLCMALTSCGALALCAVAPVSCSGEAVSTSDGGDTNDGGDAAPVSDGGTLSPPSQHRPSSASCSHTRAPGNAPQDASLDAFTTFVSCRSDSDCDAGANGRCNLGLRGGGGTDGGWYQWCTYDACFTDTDCPSMAPCECRASDSDLSGNYCVNGSGCRVDSDCFPYVCTPSRGYCTLLYECHGPGDTCGNGSDCPSDYNHNCMFDLNTKHWECATECPPDA